jgi:hypothetical protein
LHHAVVQGERAASGVAAGITGFWHRRVGAELVKLDHWLSRVVVRVVLVVRVIVCHGG